MKPSTLRAVELAAPRQQRNWDWRAAANFIAGGSGGGLLLWASMLALTPEALRTALLLGMILVGGGLTCVWFEIGRPWRALNVYRHFATSWMTREAVVALLLFAAGSLALLTLRSPLVLAAGAMGMCFLYSQARILAANKGIPAWRHPRSIALMTATGLAEGAGLLACVLALSAAPGMAILVGLLAAIIGRAFFWKFYRAGLEAGGAPEGSLRALAGIDRRLGIFGHVLPAVLATAALAGMPGGAGLAFAAGILTVAAGWFLKFTLVRRAAFTQGLALPHQPARGAGPVGAATKPGWKGIAPAKAG